ncbi:GGDEF domain-containing protein [Longispora sp. NPDC051575]|uniref:GGDEF domain-containing protein n=1 Tax=Longispora sp. NPDC051575 TaxID=3154943 RepID=UPI0034203065
MCGALVWIAAGGWAGVLGLGGLLLRTRAALGRERWAASRDPLTGLLGLRGWRRGLSVARRHPAPRLLVNVDVDRFKEVNDGWGHEVGDRVLCEIADVIAQICGPGAVVARPGGDEFVALLAAPTSAEAVAELVDQLRNALVIRRRWLPGHTVTASVGATVLHGGADLDAAVIAADRAMFEDKNQRRRPVQHPQWVRAAV